jgi:hypothetical protein
MTTLDEWSARRKTHTHTQETNYHAPEGFEPTIPAIEGPQTYALNRAATGMGTWLIYLINSNFI